MNNNDYYEILINISEPQIQEIIVARLSNENYDGFEETENGLKAFIKEENFNLFALENILNTFKLVYTKSIIPQQNWNALWESNFEHVVVDDFCEVRADFHTPTNKTEFEIIINPKMSFGTGHHATTYMMIQQMRNLDFKGKLVADFGTGTGILAILAEKLGSKKIIAIDYDEWSIENCKENIEINKSAAINIIQANAFTTTEKHDIILANINKNVILDNLAGLVFGLKAQGYLLISGILKDDEKDLIKASSPHNLSFRKTVERNNWISILFQCN